MIHAMFRSRRPRRTARWLLTSLPLACCLVAVLCLSGCGEPDGTTDAGERTDADRPAPDAARPDGSRAADAETERDAGAEPDAGAPSCPDGDTPAVTAVRGDARHGASLRIVGCRFGDQPSPAPLVWDDFEGGSSGDLVAGGWTPQRTGETHPIYTDRQSYGPGSLSLTNHVEPNAKEAPGCQFCGAYQVVEESNELYVSYRFRFDVTGNDYGILKLARLASSPNYGGVDYYNGVGTLKYQYQPHAGWGYVSLEHDADDHMQVTIAGVPRGQWHRVEMYYRLSSPAGAPNGAAYVAIDNDLDPELDIDDAVTLNADYPTQLHSLLLPLMLANPKDDGVFDLYVDDVYLDDSRARVEIGDAPTWSATTRREIQVPTAWSPAHIEVTVNQGRFEPYDPAYLYVVDANGVVNDSGYPLTVEAETME